MNSDDFPETFDPSRCVLFLGAGFSADALNKSSNAEYTHPPVGDGLNRAMKEMAEIDLNDPSDFTDTAGYLIARKLDLFGLLENLYTIRKLDQLQREVLSLPWWRIYTTNYDNSVSVYRADTGNNFVGDVFDLTEDPPRQLRKGAVIHLHGSIAKCRSDDVNASLVLTRRSYVEQRVKKSPWWDWFDRDIKTSQYTFFLGYDINDFEPASYLIKYPGMERRRHFILRSPKSPIAGSKVADYGIRHSFEMKGFVERLDRAKVEPKPSHEAELISFRYVDLAKDNKLPSKPTSAEIQELFAFGRLRFDSIKSTLPDSDYVVYRDGIIKECLAALLGNTTLIIHGKIGNGKSIISDELKVVLSQAGRQCFMLRDGITPTPQDIEFVKGIDGPVIFFPSYDSGITNIHLFEGMPDNTRYVVEIPSSTLQVRMNEALSRLKGKVGRVGVDKLDKNDITALRTVLRKAGLTSLSNASGLRDGIEFRDFLLMSYEEPEIAKRLRSVIDPLMASAPARRIICASSLFKATGLPVDVGFIEDATGEDPYAVLSGLGEGVLELMEYTIDKLEPHSSILSEHILRKYIDTKDFVGAVFNLAAEAARRMDEAKDYSSERFRRSRSLLSAVLRFRFVESIIGSGTVKRKLIGKLYEACRRDTLIEKEPLFWLQYSIFWQNEPRWDLAESHMIEAYARGEMRPEFKTYQLDTNYLGLLCDLELSVAAGQPVSRFEKLVELIDTCRAMIDDGNHRSHVTRAFSKVQPMVEKRKSDFTKGQAARLTFGLNLVVQRLDGLAPNDKAVWGTDTCKMSLEECVRKLTNLKFDR